MFSIRGPKGRLIVRKATLARVKAILPGLRRRFSRVTVSLLHPTRVVMYDSTDLSQIPRTARAVAGYVGGRWPTYAKLPARFPKAKHVSVAIAANEDARVLDIERLDATNAQAPGWVRRQRARGVAKPTLYTSVSNVAALLAVLKAAGIQRSSVLIWSAHYTGRPHLCGPKCGFGMATTADATQYTDKAYGRRLDASLCTKAFFQ